MFKTKIRTLYLMTNYISRNITASWWMMCRSIWVNLFKLTFLVSWNALQCECIFDTRWWDLLVQPPKHTSEIIQINSQETKHCVRNVNIRISHLGQTQYFALVLHLRKGESGAFEVLI